MPASAVACGRTSVPADVLPCLSTAVAWEHLQLSCQHQSDCCAEQDFTCGYICKQLLGTCLGGPMGSLVLLACFDTWQDACAGGEICFVQDAEQRLGTIYGFPVRIDPAFVHSRASRPTTRQFLIRLLSNLRLVYQGLRMPDPLLAIIRSVACCTMRFCSTLPPVLLVLWYYFQLLLRAFSHHLLSTCAGVVDAFPRMWHPKSLAAPGKLLGCWRGQGC